MASQFPDKDKAPIALIVEDDADLRESVPRCWRKPICAWSNARTPKRHWTFMARDGENVALIFSTSACRACSMVSIWRDG